jgi:hypothetical protein
MHAFEHKDWNCFGGFNPVTKSVIGDFFTNKTNNDNGHYKIDWDLFFDRTQLNAGNAIFGHLCLINLRKKTNNLLIFENALEIKPNKRYVLEGYFYDNNGYNLNTEKGIYFDFTN